MRARHAIGLASALLLTACGTSHSAGDDGGAPPDPVEFCRDKERRICARIHALEPDDAAFSACISRIDATCAAAAWVAGCVPNQEALDACLAALVETARVTVAPHDLPECASICRDP